VKTFTLVAPPLTLLGNTVQKFRVCRMGSDFLKVYYMLTMVAFFGSKTHLKKKRTIITI